jgi:serine O-acetyltransferase
MLGYGTVIGSGAKIGRNCFILQNVTIGSSKGEFPEISENVFIGGGAICIGKLNIRNDVKNGAGAIVVNDVPNNCSVVSNRARVV